MRLPRHAAWTWALSLLLGGVFFYASLDKIAHPADFARIVYHYRLIGPSQTVGPMPANLLAVTLPFVEILLSLCLLTGFWRREAAALAAVLLVVFVGSVGFALAQGIDIENCGCFTVSGAGRAAGAKLILEDVLLFCAALALVFGPQRGSASGP